MEKEDGTKRLEVVEAIVTAVIPEFELVHAACLNGDTFSIGERTTGIEWKSLRLGDKLRLEVEGNSITRVLRATLLAAAPVSPADEGEKHQTEESMEPPRPAVVPTDFPRQQMPGSVSGVQPKLAVRLVDGRFTDRLTEEELYERYDACADLVLSLTAYCRRKLAETPSMNVPTLLRRLRRGVEAKGWDLSVEEMEWIICKVELALDEALLGKASGQH